MEPLRKFLPNKFLNSVFNLYCIYDFCIIPAVIMPLGNGSMAVHLTTEIKITVHDPALIW